MKSHLNAFNGFQILGLQNSSCHFHRINIRPSREREREVTHRITFIIIYNGIREIDGISHRIFQCIKVFYRYLLPYHLQFRLFHLWWRKDNLLRCFLQFDEFIEFQFNLLFLIVYSTQTGGTSHKFWRIFIIRPTIGITNTGA